MEPPEKQMTGALNHGEGSKMPRATQVAPLGKEMLPWCLVPFWKCGQEVAPGQSDDKEGGKKRVIGKFCQRESEPTFQNPLHESKELGINSLEKMSLSSVPILSYVAFICTVCTQAPLLTPLWTENHLLSSSL